MNILVITTKSPYPLYEGRALRTYNLLKQLARRHTLYLCTFVQTPEELEGVERMREFCAEVEVEPLYLGRGRWRILWDIVRELFTRSPLLAVKYRTRAMRQRIRRLLQRVPIDVIHLDMLHLADYLDESTNRPVVLVEHNVESVLLRRRVENEANALRRFYLAYQQRKLERYEAWACARADHVITVSELDAESIRHLAPNATVTPIANGVDTEFFRTTGVATLPNRLIFVGGMTWFPNYDAIRYFADEILPRIAREVPDVMLTVIGKNPDDKGMRELTANPRLRFTGLVDDVRPHISEATVYIVPLRIGGGTRLKILDALSMQKAIVSTSVGCEGLSVVPGEQLLVADTAEQFATEVLRVLRDRALAVRLGENGRALVQRKYEWSVIVTDMLPVYDGCVKRKRA